MDPKSPSAFEIRLVAEVAKIEERIKSLTIEKQTLQRQIARLRSERTGLQEVTRKNSLLRVLAENSVVEYLRAVGKPGTTKQLYHNARATNFDLKETTFRNYLHRMKVRGIIKNAGHVGVWKLADQLTAKPGSDIFS